MPAPIARVGTLQEGHEQHTVMLKITLRAHKRPLVHTTLTPTGEPHQPPKVGGDIMSSPNWALTNEFVSHTRAACGQHCRRGLPGCHFSLAVEAGVT